MVQQGEAYEAEDTPLRLGHLPHRQLQSTSKSTGVHRPPTRRYKSCPPSRILIFFSFLSQLSLPLA